MQSYEGKELTPRELRVWYKPSTWFRKELIRRPREEFERSPQLELELSELKLNSMFLSADYQRGRISETEYQKNMARIRREMGNIVYV
ncbi:MAG: hypothetical protein QMD85_02725 [Candidatus Aenigmarchaeota archaeon]|nr:hypothetical protein [Candidatus Aenigmarchaeota archaeon]MDI6722465.1 hypothetical protein [Candidatus Aenigmarchaeota archaeon]